MSNSELKAVVYRINHNLTDQKDKFEVAFNPASDKEKVIKEAAQIAIEANNGRWALGYFVEVFNEKGILRTAFMINYDF